MALQREQPGSRESDKYVLLLGAGFSAPYGPPVMNRFMGVARRRYHAIRKENPNHDLIPHYGRMLEFQQRCLRQSGWLFNRDWENIEEVYTQADLIRLAQPSGDASAQELCDDIAWTIWDTYRKCERLTKDHSDNFMLSRLLTIVREDGLKPVIITTNYDLLTEKSLTIFKPPNGPRWRYYYPGVFE
jgi:hypothetical protein